MAFVNTSRKVGLRIGGRNYSNNLINGSISDDSTLNTAIIKASGSIVLGGAHAGNHVDLFGSRISVGSPVEIVMSVPGANSYGVLHPRGRLYVISTSTDIQQQTTNVEVGCALQLISSYEQLYAGLIFDLFNLVGDDLKYFVVSDYSLNTLDSILQTLGKAIFQANGGGIQIIDTPVGGGGYGGFTSIDQETAIEMSTFSDVSASDDPLSLSITLNFDIPKSPKEEEPEVLDNQEEEEEEEPEDPNEKDEVISDISYVKTKRYKLKPFEECLKVYRGKKIIIEFEDEKSLRSCGAYLNPKYAVAEEEIEQWISDPTACKQPISSDGFIKESRPYSYAVRGSLELEEEYFSDYVEKFSVTSNGGPGYQTDLEWTWENQSVWMYGEPILSQWFDFMRQEFENAAAEANSWMEQANQYFELRDENNYFILNEAERTCLVENSTLTEIINMKRNFAFYDCAGVNALLNADEYISYSKKVYEEVVDRFNSITNRRSNTNFSLRKTFFGEGGEVTKRISRQIVHRASSHLARNYLDKFAKVFDQQEENFEDRVIDRTTQESTVGRYEFEPKFGDPEINLYNTIDIPPVTKKLISQGSDLERVRLFYSNINGIRFDAEPLSNGNVVGLLVATTQTVEEYEYLTKNGTPLIKETTTTIDYGNTLNNSRSVKVSTDYSSAAESEAINTNAAEAQVEAEEEEIDLLNQNPCGLETEAREIIYRVERARPFIGPQGPLQDALSLYDEPISLPAQLRPLTPQRLNVGQVLTPDDCNTLSSDVIQEAAERLGKYEQIINKYLVFEMMKRLGDNRGFRVTESMRPELYNYHPYMNISMISRTNGFIANGMVGSANWVFDQSNALASFDCYVFGYNSGIPFGSSTAVSIQKPIEIPQGDYIVLTKEILEISDNAYTVTLQRLENEYLKYYLDDVELEEEPEVAVIDIVNGRLRLYDLTPEEPTEEPAGEGG